MTTQVLNQLGGIFAVLVFWHFLADWVFQTHKEAMSKATNWRVRLRHCVVYAFLFWPLFWLTGFEGDRAAMATGILLTSHFIIDTYIPVMLWAKYLRRAPQFEGVGMTRIMRPWQDKVVDPITYKTDAEAFKAFAATPIGLVLMITMDQFFHIAFLLPVAWLMVQ